MTVLSAGGGSAYGGKLLCALAAVLGLSAFTNAPAGTIGGTNTEEQFAEG